MAILWIRESRRGAVTWLTQSDMISNWWSKGPNSFFDPRVRDGSNSVPLLFMIRKR